MRKSLVKKVKFEPNDEFFAEGNKLCGFRKENFQTKVTSIENDSTSDYETCSQINDNLIICNAFNCRLEFTNERDFNDHYQTFHCHVCSACAKHFPSEYLLDIHIAESHDPFFEFLTSKKLSYRCFVEACSEKFISDRERKEHMIKIHNYPGNFSKKEGHRKQEGTPKIEVDESEAPMTEANRREKMLPRNICFGAGVPKAFKKPTNIRKPWHKHSSKDESPRNDVIDIDMRDLKDALH